MARFRSRCFDKYGMSIVRLTEWLDAASRDGTAGDFPMIVLPMIQRGSVWRPHQVMDLWDTLLRGLPVGSMIAGWARAGDYFTPISRELKTLGDNQGLSLVDGQQRTLAMLTGWPATQGAMNRSVWIDLGADDNHDHLFRFHFTTEFQPFGFEPAGPSGSAVGKLSRDTRRRALAAFEANHGRRDANEARLPLWGNAFPWSSLVPINLRDIFGAPEVNTHWLTGEFEKRRMQQLDYWTKANSSAQFPGAFGHKIAELHKIDTEEAAQRIGRLVQAVAAFRKLNMPLVRIPDSAFDTSADKTESDPVLAVLFQRIGTGGTSLSNADYVYSMLKHHSSKCHSMVETMLQDEAASALYDPVALVSSAVRLVAGAMGLSDHAQINKVQFARLLREGNFLATFEASIAESGAFSRGLTRLLQDLRYKPGTKDIGFPRHALRLVRLPVLEVMLFWFQLSGREELDEANRHRLIRFAIYCRLAVDNNKLHRASEELFGRIKALGQHGGLDDFPEAELTRMLVDGELALPMPAPDDYRADPKLWQMVFHRRPNATGPALRGQARFAGDDLGDDQKRAVELYRRFWEPWTHQHELLLWLQREYVFAEFDKAPVLPGSDDETPYDYDHICPQSHWSNSRGEAALNRFHQEPWVLGNGIGNVRVWESSGNRSDRDLSPDSKLDELKRLASLVGCDPEEQKAWSNYSERTSQPRQWDADRSAAFQQAIEQRTFNLFCRFHADLEFPAFYRAVAPQPALGDAAAAPHLLVSENH